MNRVIMANYGKNSIWEDANSDMKEVNYNIEINWRNYDCQLDRT